MRSALVRHPFVPFEPFDPFDLAVTRNPKHCPLAKLGCATQAICCREAQCGSPFLDYVLPPERAAAAKMAAFPVSVSRRQNACVSPPSRRRDGETPPLHRIPPVRDAAATSHTTSAKRYECERRWMDSRFGTAVRTFGAANHKQLVRSMIA